MNKPDFKAITFRKIDQKTEALKRCPVCDGIIEWRNVPCPANVPGCDKKHKGYYCNTCDMSLNEIENYGE